MPWHSTRIKPRIIVHVIVHVTRSCPSQAKPKLRLKSRVMESSVRRGVKTLQVSLKGMSYTHTYVTALSIALLHYKTLSHRGLEQSMQSLGSCTSPMSDFLRTRTLSPRGLQ